MATPARRRVKGSALAASLINMLPDAVLNDVLAYAREVCFNVGHVRTGVGDMDRCSRCGEPVTDETMKESIEVSFREEVRRLQGVVIELLRAIEDGVDHCDRCRKAIDDAIAILR